MKLFRVLGIWGFRGSGTACLHEVLSSTRAKKAGAAFASQPASVCVASFPKGPCTFIVYTWPLKLLYRNPFKAQVSTIYVHGPFGFLLRRSRSLLR